jgi:hypothetical protein
MPDTHRRVDQQRTRRAEPAASGKPVAASATAPDPSAGGIEDTEEGAGGAKGRTPAQAWVLGLSGANLIIFCLVVLPVWNRRRDT